MFMKIFYDSFKKFKLLYVVINKIKIEKKEY